MQKHPRTYRRIRSERTGVVQYSGRLDFATSPEHLERIRQHEERIQAELVHHPEEPIWQDACVRAQEDRRALLIYVAVHEPIRRRHLTLGIGWHIRRVENALNSPWFVRAGGRVRLTLAGRAEFVRIREEERKSC